MNGEVGKFSPLGACPAAMTSLDLLYDGSVGQVDLSYTGGIGQVTFTLPGPPYFLVITQPSEMGGLPGEPGSSVMPMFPISEPPNVTPPPGGSQPGAGYKGGTGQESGGGAAQD